MSTYYVSNVAINGYALGVDTNNGTSLATPFLTIAHACAVVAATDSIVVNPSGTAYSEDSGSGYLQIPSCVSIGGDASLYATVGAPTVRAVSSGATRVMNLSGSVATSIGPFIVDGQSRASQAGFTFSGSPSAVTFTQVSWKNCLTYTISVPSAACGITLDRCVIDSTNTNTNIFNFSSATTLSSLTVTGGSYYGPAGASAVFYLNTSNISGNVTFQADSSGNLVDFTGTAAPWCIRVGATIGGKLTISGTKHNASAGGIFPHICDDHGCCRHYR
jgi:hypothetical protein